MSTKTMKKSAALAAFTAPTFYKATAAYTPPPPKVFIGGPVSRADLDGSVLMDVAYRACTTRRAHGSETEAQFCAWLATTFGATMIDGAGGIHFDRRLRSDGTMSRTLYTSHADTVDNQGGTQHIYTDEQGRWGVDSSSKCLGADDGAGIALMMHMIAAGVHGYWIVTREEESGGVGAKWLADNMAPLLKQFDRAIAFDRAGYTEVITHQGGERCASDEFGEALAVALSSVDDAFIFAASDEGVYTDTKEFTDIIPECTNTSVFYGQQHGNNEWLDIKALRKFADVVCAIDWDALPTKRDPKVYESKWGNYGAASKYKDYTEYYGTSASRREAAWMNTVMGDDDDTHTGHSWPHDYADLLDALDQVTPGHAPALVNWVAIHAAQHYEDQTLDVSALTALLNRHIDTLSADEWVDYLYDEAASPLEAPGQLACEIVESLVN